MSRRWSLAFAAFLLVSMVGCDHATKFMARAHLADGARVALVDGILELRYAENNDAGFGALRWIDADVRKPLLLTVGGVAIAVMGVLLTRRRTTWLERVALAVVLAGAIGNFSDRLFRGGVVDFIHLTHWPIFNVADICLVVGAGLLIWCQLRPGERAAPAAPSG